MENTNLIKETSQITIGYDNNDKKVLNGLTIMKLIGKGSYAKVKLGIREGKEYVMLK
jgi:hypothetical protein